MKTLGLVPNINVKKEAVLCTLNTNMQTAGSVLWLKKKLKSFLMNNVSFYFRASITSKHFAMATLSKLHQVAAEKYVACAQEFRRFHLTPSKIGTGQNEFLQRLDLVLAQVMYVVIRSLFKYLVCNMREASVFTKDDYHDFFAASLPYYTGRFAENKNEFPGVHRILVAKQKSFERER
jgi:hypothetical protein